MTPDWLLARPIAHRGLHDTAAGVVENTLAAAEAAVAAGFAIECDVQLSRDGEAFVFHDFTLDRLTDATGALIELSAAGIRKAGLVGAAPLLPPGEGGRRSRPDEGLPLPSPVERRANQTGQEIFVGAVPSSGASRHLLPGGEGDRIPTFAELLALIAGRTPIVCELKSRFDRDFRIADRVAALAQSYDGPLAFKSFDPDLIAYLRLRWPQAGPSARPMGLVAEASYDGPAWDALSPEKKCDWTAFEHYDRVRPDFLSWNVDDLPHAIPFLVRELNGAPVMAWTVRRPEQREAAHKWADQIVFEGAGRP